jgi:hypothetical protein
VVHCSPGSCWNLHYPERVAAHGAHVLCRRCGGNWTNPLGYDRIDHARHYLPHADRGQRASGQVCAVYTNSVDVPLLIDIT